MKKYFYFLIAACLLFPFCSKEEQKEKKEDKEEKEPNRRERGRWCPDPFYVFSVDIKKESADYALFFKGTQIDKEAIYFFKEVNGKQQRYYPMDVDFHNGKTVRVSIVEPFDFFTGEKETFYLRNRTKSYKIDILGFYGYRKNIQYGKEYFCGYYFNLEEVYINDVETQRKRDEGPYTPSEHIDLP